MSLRNGVSLAKILNQLARFQSGANTEEADRVRDLDTAISVEKSNYKLPFRRVKTTVKIFDGIVTYPLPVDYDELSFLDNKGAEYEEQARFQFRSFNEFLENKDERNDWCEIHNGGDVMLGCRYKLKQASARRVDSAEDSANYTASGDASNLVEDTVTFDEGSGSIRFTVTNSSGTATIEDTFTAFSDTNYAKKYYFRKVYFDSVPTSVALRFGSSSANYLYKTGITAQFSGQAFEADAWNIVAFDLSSASSQGTLNPAAFSYEAIVLSGAASGTYYLDASHIRGWELLDLWYYSKYMIQLIDETFQEFFMDSADAYSTDSILVGPPEWANFIKFCAMLYMLGERESDALYSKVSNWRDRAEEKLKARYKSVTPMITNSYWNFRKDFQQRYGITPQVK